MEIIHTPVLLEETIQFLAPRSPGELMVDATLGEGGHSYAFLSRFPDLKIAGIDADRDIQEIARKRLG
jgi:16S rRNA (cytosine1402-N4)-methyltransferase